MPKLCKRGRKMQTFHISGSERMQQNRSSEIDTERTLRLQQMRYNQLIRLRVLTPNQKGSVSRSSESATECALKRRLQPRGKPDLDQLLSGKTPG